MEAGMFEPGGSSLYHYLITQPYVYLHYIAMFILPLQLSADTDWSTFNGINEPGALIGFLFLILLAITAIICSNKKILRPVSFGIVWFLLALVPTTFVPLAEVMNDHRQFYPHVGTSLAFTWSLFLIYQRWFKHFSYKPLVLICLLILCGYAYGTYQRNKVWKSEETLWKDVTEKSPLNGRGLMNYGLALMAKGDYIGAEAYFRRGLELWPYYSYLYINIAIVKEATGKTEEADYYYRKGLEYGKDYPNNYYFYGKYLYKKGEKDKAIEYLRKALEMSSALTDARYLLMDALYETRRLNELQNICTQTLQILPGDQKAITYLSLAKSGKSKAETMEETLRQNPSAEGYLNLSLQYYEDQNYLKCIEAAQKALELKKDYAEAWNNICAAYNAMQMFVEAEKACNEALRIKSDYALARNNLIWAQQNLKK
ncbi:MAG: tetratricopeptide repeat protein [Chitinophagales bacterium]|nr:tetratricopeptide repeat protein [Chitinophagales bacterium]